MGSPKLDAKNEELFEERLKDSYSILRRIAQKHLELNKQKTLSATELVHEFYLQINENKLEVNNTGHFISLASQCMKWILLDYSKSKKRQKRGSGIVPLEFNEELHSYHISEETSCLAEAMEKLFQESQRTGLIAELRFILGLEIKEIAQLIGISEATVKRECANAKEWLAKELYSK